MSGFTRLARLAARTLIYNVPHEAEQCAACGSRDLFDLDLLAIRGPVEGKRTGFVSACNECGLVFSNPLPSHAELAQFYSGHGEWEVPDKSASRPRVPRPGSGSPAWTTWFDATRPHLDVRAPPRGARVLDFGCGPGKLLDGLQRYGWDTWGIEPATEAAFVRHGRLDSPPADGSFDLVVAHHVLEHVADPLEVLRQLAGACREGGHLLITVPCLDALGRHRDYEYVINDRVHIVAYTRAALSGLLGRSGWRVVTPEHRDATAGSHTTVSRMRLVAQRVTVPVALPRRPADAARRAFRGFYAGTEWSVLERAGFLRLAARRAESRRRAAVRSRKTAKRDASGPSPT